MNKAILIGNVGNNPEVRTLDNGVKVATFSLATTENYTKKDGAGGEPQKVSQTTWHRIEVWNSLVNIAQSYIHKGDRLSIDGKIIIQKYVDKDEIERTSIKIRAERIEFLGKKREEIESQKEPNASTKSDIKKGKSEKLPDELNKVVFETASNPSDDLPF